MLLDAQQTANRLLRFPVATTGLRGMTFMASLFLSRDFTANKGALCNAFSQAGHTLRHFTALHDFTTAVNMIDDRMDHNDPSWILRAGEAHYGLTPSPLFLSTATCPREFTFAFNAIVNEGLTDRNNAMAHNNILAVHTHKKAQIDAAFRQAPTRDLREKLTEENFIITESYASFVFRCLAHSMIPQEDLNHLTHADVVEKLPEIARISRVGQIMDDIRDLLIDLEIELFDGVPTSNWLALQMVKNGEFLDGRDRFNPVMQYVLKRTARFEADTNPPAFVKDALERGRAEVDTLLEGVGSPASRAIQYAFFDNTVAEGLKSSLHNDVIRKDRKRDKEIRTLQQKYASQPDCALV